MTMTKTKKISGGEGGLALPSGAIETPDLRTESTAGRKNGFFLNGGRINEREQQ